LQFGLNDDTGLAWKLEHADDERLARRALAESASFRPEELLNWEYGDYLDLRVDRARADKKEREYLQTLQK
jgi:hypothetical protein